jgi:hypothetical protein
MKTLGPIAILLIIVMSLSCTDKHGANAGNDMNKETAFIFVDRSHAHFEHAYVVSTMGIFAQVSVFPGHTDRKLFLLPRLPESLATEAKQWEQLPGEIKPPFIPDGPWFSRTAVVGESKEPPTTDYFKDSNEGLHKWLLELREVVVKEEYRVAEPPQWIAENNQITSRLGM